MLEAGAVRLTGGAAEGVAMALATDFNRGTGIKGNNAGTPATSVSQTGGDTETLAAARIWGAFAIQVANNGGRIPIVGGGPTAASAAIVGTMAGSQHTLGNVRIAA
jgi:hypothetical protein